MRLMSVEVKEKEMWWSFIFYGDPKHLSEWNDNDLEMKEIIGDEINTRVFFNFLKGM